MIKGLVQGVGFRPFICRLAAKHSLLGEVDNRSDGVSVVVHGDPANVDLFSNDIMQYAPPASQIKSIEIMTKMLNVYSSFSITKSKNIDNRITEVSPDIAVCQECLDDMDTDPERIDYPFINCTNCGPRFTIIENLPYDRQNTTMSSFPMCNACLSEYDDILDRRFHAQPVACNKCGPVCKLKDGEKDLLDIHDITEEIALQISSGKSVAIKGMGGYHLMCDALNHDAVSRLRQRKQRDAKPFAVMFRDINSLIRYCFADDEELREITSWRRPVVILKQKELLSEEVNNGLRTIGAMLPYMPLHHLLFRKLKTPAVILTSGNVSDEPVIIDDKKAEAVLGKIADSVLSYNREILNRADDSVIRIINRNPSFIRRSRGYVPRPVDLKLNVEGVIGFGAELKNTFSIGKGYQAVISQHIGDLKNKPTYDFLIESIERFSKLFRFKPLYAACDLHPDYISTRHAEIIADELDIPLVSVQHHHAHIVSCLAEHGLNEEVIGISLDGTGYGSDGMIWGGEFLIADLRSFRRFTHFDYVQLPGGDKVVDEPWRTALSYIHKYFGGSFDVKSIPAFRSLEDEKIRFVKDMLERNINSPFSSGAGRLFDAVSAILGLCISSGFDSEAPIRLESVIESRTEDLYPFRLDDTVVFADTLEAIIEDIKSVPVPLISVKFHNTVASVILKVSQKIRGENSLNKVVLSGGVFQNKYLLEKSLSLLTNDDFIVYTNNVVPCNDGGISLGQLVIASKLLK